MYRELFLFLLLFFIFPYFHANFLYRRIFAEKSSPIATYVYSCLLTVAINCFLLAGTYLLFRQKNDLFYLITIILFNLLFIALFSIKNFSKFTHECIKNIQSNWAFSLFALIVFYLFFSLITLIRPFGSDILDYFQIGKLLYLKKDIIYQGFIVNEDNAFSAHVFHPPFYTLLLSLGYLIQGSAEYFRVNNYILAYFSISFLSTMLLLMRQNIYFGFLILIFGLFTSTYAFNTFILPNGLDAFRCSYFLLSFALLQELLTNRTMVLKILFALSLAASLSTHSSGLLFTLLMLIIYLACYVEKNPTQKYLDFFKICLMTCCIGGLQYAINFHHIGKLISDDLPIWKLFDQNTYLRFERNIFSKKHMLHVIYNQFFTPNKASYGYLFSLAFVIGIFGIKTQLQQLKQAFLNFFSIKQKTLLDGSEYLLFIVGFYTVLLITIFADQALIIKNFRYLMTVYPLMILFIFVNVSKILSILHHYSWKDFADLFKTFIDNTLEFSRTNKFNLVLFVFALFLSYNMLNFLKTAYSPYTFTPQEFFTQDAKRNLDKLLPGMSPVVRYLEKNVNPSDSVFAFDSGQLYQFFPYLKIYNHLDDRFISLYQIQSTKDLYAALQKHHIKLIFLADYRPSILLKSRFNQLLTNPKYASLVVQAGNYFVFRLNDEIKENPHIHLVQTLHATLLPNDARSLDIPLEKDKLYLFNIIPHQENIFYQVNAHTPFEYLANYTFNGSSQFLFSSTHLKEQKLRLDIFSKNYPINLKIKISEFS